MKQQTTQSWSVASFICSVIGLALFLMPYIGVVLSILAIIFSAKDKEAGLSRAGMVMGIIGICINTLMLGIVAITLMAGLY